MDESILIPIDYERAIMRRYREGGRFSVEVRPEMGYFMLGVPIHRASVVAGGGNSPLRGGDYAYQRFRQLLIAPLGIGLRRIPTPNGELLPPRINTFQIR